MARLSSRPPQGPVCPTPDGFVLFYCCSPCYLLWLAFFFFFFFSSGFRSHAVSQRVRWLFDLKQTALSFPHLVCRPPLQGSVCLTRTPVLHPIMPVYFVGFANSRFSDRSSGSHDFSPIRLIVTFWTAPLSVTQYPYHRFSDCCGLICPSDGGLLFFFLDRRALI